MRNQNTFPQSTLTIQDILTGIVKDADGLTFMQVFDKLHLAAPDMIASTRGLQYILDGMILHKEIVLREGKYFVIDKT